MFEEEGASYACQSPAPSTKSVFVGQFKSDKLRSFSWLDHISIRWVAQLILLYHVSTSLDAAYLFSFFDCTKLSGMFLEAGWNGVSKRALMRDWVGCVLWWREVLGRCLKCLECSCWPHCALFSTVHCAHTSSTVHCVSVHCAHTGPIVHCACIGPTVHCAHTGPSTVPISLLLAGCVGLSELFAPPPRLDHICPSYLPMPIDHRCPYIHKCNFKRSI